MRKTIFRAFGILLSIGLIAQFLSFLPTQAALAGSRYKIFPVRTDLNINRGSSTTTTVYIQNVSGATENIQSLFNDFIANPNESGSPDLLLNGQTNSAHGLKQYVTISPMNFTLQPQAEEAVKITIAIPKVAAPGGYYGAIRFAPQSTSSQKNVNLSVSVASLILVKVPGNYYENLNITDFSSAQNGNPRAIFTSTKKLQAIIVFQNTGQVQEEPFGKVVLMKGKKQINTFAINQTNPPGNVLPNSSRKFSVNISGANSIGKYTLIGNFGYGSKGQLISATTTFWVVPLSWIIAFIVLLVLLLLFVALWLRKHAKKSQSL